MRSLTLPLLSFIACLACHSAVRAQAELQAALKDTNIAPHWIYDNFPKALAEAKASGKPILVVLRCVPCPPGRTLDGQVMQPDKDLEQLEKQFVCVRIIQTNGLDLDLFQYDFDQSWAAFFVNADLAIYGRYGTRVSSGPKSDFMLSLASFRKAMERALELHKAYPGNKAQLAGKTGKKADYRHPEQIPGLADRGKVATTRQSCIHCHMVREFQLRAKWEQKKLSLDDLWVYPMPDNIGLRMDIDDGLLVKSVQPGSPAEQAGIAAGDELISINGQALISLADIQWVLHTAPAKTELAVSLRRGGKPLDTKVALSGNWKESDIAWRASSWYGLRYGLKTEPLGAAEREKHGLAADVLALAVKGIFGKGAVKLSKAGLKTNDIIVAVDGKTEPMNESRFLIYLRLTHGPDDAVRFSVLRGEQRLELTVPMW